MKAIARSSRQFLTTLALLGTATVAALSSPTVHAGTRPLVVGTVPPLALLPHITVQVQPGAAVLAVTGYSFGPGDGVHIAVVDRGTQALLTSVQTTASIAHLICSGNSTCYPVACGTISVHMPPVYVHCGYRAVSVSALDLKTGLHSNMVLARLGAGPC